jgi:hypothetical protein
MTQSPKRPKLSGGVVAAMRARAREVDVLVQEIAAAMVGGSWPGTLAAELVEREGVKPKVVQQWSAEAGRLLRIGPDVELYRGINLRRLDTHAVSSDGKVAVAAVSEQNKMLGLHAPTMHKVDVRGRPHHRGCRRDSDRLSALRQNDSCD